MLKQRVVAGIVLVPLGIAAILFLPHPAFAALAGAIFVMGAWEWSRLAGWTTPVARWLYTISVAAALAALWWIDARSLYLTTIAVGGAAWAGAAAWLSRFQFASGDTPPVRILKGAVGLLILTACFATVVSLHRLPGDGPRWVLAVLAAVWITDTAAYFSGRAFGKRRMAPRISPNKTWAGAIGAFCASMTFISGALYVLVGPQVSPLAVVVLGLVTTAFAMVGDLFVSLLKRHRQIKDTGHLIPGHGGILDRFDGVLAAVPVFVLTKAALGL